MFFDEGAQLLDFALLLLNELFEGAHAVFDRRRFSAAGIFILCGAGRVTRGGALVVARRCGAGGAHTQRGEQGEQKRKAADGQLDIHDASSWGAVLDSPVVIIGETRLRHINVIGTEA
jgi:hypothetical protein